MRLCEILNIMFICICADVNSAHVLVHDVMCRQHAIHPPVKLTTSTKRTNPSHVQFNDAGAILSFAMRN